MAQVATWQLLNYDHTDLPWLFISANFTSEGCAVHISDLSGLWVEELDRSAITRRADDLKCSIDPGEDDQQYETFAKLVCEAFISQTRSKLEIQPGPKDSLLLKVRHALPEPLPPLYWEAHLQRARSPSVRTKLVEPLLQEVQVLRQQKSSLVAEIAAKDHVITRMADRLDALGMPMGDIFPNVANLSDGRRAGSSRSRLAQHVRGLDTFDYEAWRARNKQVERAKPDRDAVADILHSLASPVLVANDDKTSRWWQNVDIKLEGINTPLQNHKVSTQARKRRDQDRQLEGESSLHESSTNDDFQVQQTPPGLQDQDDLHSKPDRTTTEGGLEVDTDGEGSPNASKPEDDRKTSPRHTKGARKLGTIGGRRNLTSHRAEPERQTDENQKPKPKPKAKLGAIGGRKRVTTVSEEQSAQHASTQTTGTAPLALSPQRRNQFSMGGPEHDSVRLGRTIEPSPMQAEVVPQQDHAAQSHMADNNLKLETEDISGDARADNRREELKRRLEEKERLTSRKKRF